MTHEILIIIIISPKINNKLLWTITSEEVKREKLKLIVSTFNSNELSNIIKKCEKSDDNDNMINPGTNASKIAIPKSIELLK